MSVAEKQCQCYAVLDNRLVMMSVNVRAPEGDATQPEQLSVSSSAEASPGERSAAVRGSSRVIRASRAETVRLRLAVCFGRTTHDC